MSRIQDILSKAEREGAVRHTHTHTPAAPPRSEASPPGAAASPRRHVERAPLREARPLPEALREVDPGTFDSLLVAALGNFVGAHFGAGGPWWTQDFGF